MKTYETTSRFREETSLCKDNIHHNKDIWKILIPI